MNADCSEKIRCWGFRRLPRLAGIHHGKLTVYSLYVKPSDAAEQIVTLLGMFAILDGVLEVLVNNCDNATCNRSHDCLSSNPMKKHKSVTDMEPTFE